MSLKTLLMPAISQRLLSRQRLLTKRDDAEKVRLRKQLPHQIHYFHQVDDPYSALAAQVLPRLLAAYDIQLVPHLAPPPIDSAAPERDKLISYSRRDAQWLAQRFGLVFEDHGRQPEPAAIQTATAMLAAKLHSENFATIVGQLSTALWAGHTAFGEWAAASPQAAAAAMASGQSERKRLGHYLGATFYYGGEWYWGLDRLYHLEQRLQAVGAARPGTRGMMFPPATDLTQAVSLQQPNSIDFFFSLRSPYSAIVAPRVFALAQLTGARINLRYVMPMVMRGLPVPPEKRSYIAADAAREAFSRGIAFGRLNDPVGKPTERGIALMPLAEKAGVAQAYVLSFMRGVWAEGIDAGSNAGLRKITERAGLSWADAALALKNEHWREVAETNRNDMFALGLWGVPSFRVGQLSVWGQDRLGAIQDELLKGAACTP